MALVPAAELSAVHGGHEDLHILGYGLDHTDAHLLATLEDYRGDRARRIHAMADRLRELGWELDESHLQRETPGRPHLADALLATPRTRRGWRPRASTARTRCSRSTSCRARSPTCRARAPPSRRRSTLIHSSGGVAVWAHPFWDLDDPAETLATLDEFAAAGMDGVEVFYATHSEEQTRLLHAAARERGLLTTGSTDFHGPGHERFAGFRGFALYGLEPVLGPIGA